MFNTSVLPACYINTYIVPSIIKSKDIFQNSKKNCIFMQKLLAVTQFS